MEQTTEDLHIQSLRGRNIFELSGGEKQKIAFASVYAMNPEIYLLDEPSSNLDMTSIQELREHLQLIKGQGKTILIAEHRLYYLMDIADRIVYLDRGAIQGIFTPTEFRRLSQDQQGTDGAAGNGSDGCPFRRPVMLPVGGNGVVAEKCLPAL